MKVIKIIKYIYISIVSIIILFFITFLLATVFSNKGYTEVFGISFFEVKSYSMYPELTKGDLVVVKKRDKSYYEVGMVVTYITPNDKIPTTHKIVSIEGDTVITRGVNKETNNTDDPIGIIIIVLSGFLFIEGFTLLEEKILKKES